jgi:hypothetical protein
MTFRACSSPAPTRVKPQPAPAILSQESVHTMLSITHHTRERPSTGPRTTHGPHPRHQVPCNRSRVVPGAHRVVGPGTHRGSGPREVHTTGGLMYILMLHFHLCIISYLYLCIIDCICIIRDELLLYTWITMMCLI